MAAIRSRLECIASDSTPRLPVATARNTLSATSTSAEPMDPSAAICLTDVGDLVMEESSEELYDGRVICGACFSLRGLIRARFNHSQSRAHQTPQTEACVTSNLVN